MPPRWVDCPVCGERYMRSREDWGTCLRCEGPPKDAQWANDYAAGLATTDAGEECLT